MTSKCLNYRELAAYNEGCEAGEQYRESGKGSKPVCPYRNKFAKAWQEGFDEASGEASVDPTEHLLAGIAKTYLFLETLETRGRDSLDCHELGVAQIKLALTRAYEAGLSAGKNGR